MLRGRGQRGRQKSKHTILVAHCSGILEYLQQDPNFSHHSKPLTNLSKLLKEVDFEDMASRYPFPVLSAFTASSEQRTPGRSTCNTRTKGSQQN